MNVAAPALVIFDVDGTLVDSQAHIVAAMTAMYAAHDRTPPARARMLSIVGLSLPVAIAALEPDLSEPEVEVWVEAYRGAFVDTRLGTSPSPLYPGALEVLDNLGALDHIRLGIATGKSRRGLRHVLAAHDLAARFVTAQTADDHPSKPHPAMVRAALSEADVAPERAVIVGDTVFDIEMGRAAGIATIGVAWGYHRAEMLHEAGADTVIDRFADLTQALSATTEVLA